MTYQEYRFIKYFDDKLDRILRKQDQHYRRLVFHIQLLGVRIMATFDELAQAVTENATAIGTLSTEVGKLPGQIDRMEAKITAAIKGAGITPAQQQQLDDAVSTLRAQTTAVAEAAATAAKAAADAADDTDEAEGTPPPVDDPPVDPTNPAPASGDQPGSPFGRSRP